MFKVLILPCIGIVVLLQFRLNKESKTYNVVERDSSFYIDTNGTEIEYINSNQITTGMNIEIKGKIVGINDTIVVSESFSKREFKVITTDQYPNTYKVQVTKDKCALLDKFKVGDEVNVHCNLNGREWTNPTTQIVSNFISLDCWRIEQVTNEVKIENTILEEPPF